MDHTRRADRSEGDVRARPIDGIRRTVVRHDDAGAQLQAVAYEHRSGLWLDGDGSDAEIRIAVSRSDGYFTRHAEEHGAERQELPNVHDPLPSEVRRPDWRGTRGACGSLVALRRRLSPGLPFRAPSGRGRRPTVYRLLPERNGRQQLDDFSSRWRPGGPSDSRRRSPVALRHRLSTALL